MPPATVVFVESSAGGVVGGSLTATVDLLRALDGRRIAPVLVRFAPSALDDDVRALGIALHVLDALPARREPSHAWRLWRGALRARALLTVTLPRTRALGAVFDDVRPDVVFAANGVPQNLDAILAAGARRIPLVCLHRSPRRLGMVDRLASRAIDVGAGVTDAIVDEMRRGGVRARRWMTIPDAIDAGRFLASGGDAIRRAAGIPDDAPVVGMLGHVQPWKGHLLAVDAMARARRVVPALRMLLVGGEHRSGHETAARLRARIAEPDLGGAVTWLGERRDVAACLDAMDVVIHTSLRPEPFGRGVLEAMAVGRPVIAPREGGPASMVVDGETGLLVPPRDPEAFARAIVRLVRDPDGRTAMGRAAATRVRSHFALDRQARSVETLIDTVLAARGRS